MKKETRLIELKKKIQSIEAEIIEEEAKETKQ